MTVYNNFGMEMIAEADENVERCVELSGARQYDLNVGRHFVSFSNASSQEVSMIIEAVTNAGVHDDGVDECTVDTDGDGLLNENDNCPYVSNADQTNSDGLGNGDACELAAPACAP